jgi:hypothetical protein
MRQKSGAGQRAGLPGQFPTPETWPGANALLFAQKRPAFPAWFHMESVFFSDPQHAGLVAMN